MSYDAVVVSVLIASPSDVGIYREIARDVINDWNCIHSSAMGAVLLPVAWETHATPELGNRPQQLINDRVLKDCDILVAIFWHRMGTPTGEFESGTAEEIQRHLDANKPAMVYFCSAALPATVDLGQVANLRKFRDWCQERGLVWEFDGETDFRLQLARHLPIELNKSPYLQQLLNGRHGTYESVTPRSAAWLQRVAQQLSHPMRDKALRLSENARSFLKQMGQSGGTAFVMTTLDGTSVHIGGAEVAGPDDKKSVARAESAVAELVHNGYVVARNKDGSLLEIAAPGYDMIEYLEIE